LILAGDRDDFCTVEQALSAYRQLPDGELAILAGHSITGGLVKPASLRPFADRACAGRVAEVLDRLATRPDVTTSGPVRPVSLVGVSEPVSQPAAPT
jgi:hypothetical protein